MGELCGVWSILSIKLVCLFSKNLSHPGQDCAHFSCDYFLSPFPAIVHLLYIGFSMCINPIKLYHPVRDFIVVSQARKQRLSEVKRFARVPQVSLSWHTGTAGGCYNWGRSSEESRNTASLRDSWVFRARNWDIDLEFLTRTAFIIIFAFQLLM